MRSIDGSSSSELVPLTRMYMLCGTGTLIFASYRSPILASVFVGMREITRVVGFRPLANARGLRNLNVVSGPIDPGYDPRQAQGARSIQQAFGENGKFLGPALRAFGVTGACSSRG